jgi:hypothetical protein
MKTRESRITARVRAAIGEGVGDIWAEEIRAIGNAFEKPAGAKPVTMSLNKGAIPLQEVISFHRQKEKRDMEVDGQVRTDASWAKDLSQRNMREAGVSGAHMWTRNERGKW